MSITITAQVADSLGATAVATATATIGAVTDIIPSSRRTLWQPGVTYNAIPAPGTAGATITAATMGTVFGIPNRTKIFNPGGLSPSGGDDTAAIQSLLNAAGLAASYSNQLVVMLNAGTFKISGSGLFHNKSWLTLRGAGPGSGASGGNIAHWATGGNGNAPLVGGGTGTFLFKSDRATNFNYGCLYVGNDPTQFGSSVNLTADAALGAYSCTLAGNPGLSVGQIVLVDHDATKDSNVVFGPSFTGGLPWDEGWFTGGRFGRTLCQMMEVTAISGNTVTFATPFHWNFQVACGAQLTTYAQPVVMGAGVEELCVMGGMGGDFHGNIPMSLCAYSWCRHVESYWHVGTSIGLYGCYRCEVRDSFLHVSANPNPGGGGYLSGLNNAASDCLFENNIMWCGNKVNVMRSSGGGNVIAYNYMDGSLGAGYPSSAEAGVNAGHFSSPHMELLEGNYSHNFKGDSYWGNSIYITVFRNWLSGIRAQKPPLQGYAYDDGSGHVYPYGDYDGRSCVDVQAYSFNHNFVGNVLGFDGQTLLSYSGTGYSSSQTRFVYENLDAFLSDNAVCMWNFGAYQATLNSTGNWSWVATTYQTQLRQGNWDWFTKSQQWHGIGGSNAHGGNPTAPFPPIPDSLYLTSKPTFFGSYQWPWVDPSTGTTHELPARARFKTIMGLSPLPPGNQ